MSFFRRKLRIKMIKMVVMIPTLQQRVPAVFNKNSLSPIVGSWQNGWVG